MIKKVLLLIVSAAFVFSCSTSQKSEETSQESEEVVIASEEIEGRVFFVSPADGDTLTGIFTIEMGVEGMAIEPAGEIVEGKGHHHLIIDGTFTEEGEIIPADPTHIHYGKGQTSAEVELTPGNHTLTLQFANGIHASYGEKWSSTISVFVKE